MIFFIFFVIITQVAIAQNTKTKGFVEFKMEDLAIKKTKSPSDWVQKDSLFIIMSNGQQYIVHSIEANQTLFSIKNFYAVDLSDLYYSNPGLEANGLKIGQKIFIPFLTKALKKFKSTEFKDTSHLPIYYKVRPSETMYRIARVYFRLPIDVLKSRNNLLTDELAKDQILHIGWISKAGIPDSLKNFAGIPGVLGEESQNNKYRYEAKFNGKNEHLIEGVAYWDKAMDLSAKNKLYVMCSFVPKGSVVRIENPMTNRFLYAEVVSAKPQNSSTQEAIVVLTPTVAQVLGGLDSRFFVKLYYCKQ